MPKMPQLPLSISRINKYVINRVTGPVYKASMWCLRVPSLAEGILKLSKGLEKPPQQPLLSMSINGGFNVPNPWCP